MLRIRVLSMSFVAVFSSFSFIPAQGQQAPLPEAMQWGGDALAMCDSSRITPNQWVCMAWINGAVQSAGVSFSVNVEAPNFCTPEYGGSVGQYRDVFVKYLKENPSKRHLPAIFLFYQSMAAAFPCPSSSAH